MSSLANVLYSNENLEFGLNNLVPDNPAAYKRINYTIQHIVTH